MELTIAYSTGQKSVAVRIGAFYGSQQSLDTKHSEANYQSDRKWRRVPVYKTSNGDPSRSGSSSESPYNQTRFKAQVGNRYDRRQMYQWSSPYQWRMDPSIRMPWSKLVQCVQFIVEYSYVL
jgi:hypothetical protein